MDGTSRAERDAQTQHQDSAKAHEDAAARLYAHGDDAAAVQERDLGRAQREAGEIAAERAQLSRERHRANADEGPQEPGPDRQIGMQPDPPDAGAMSPQPRP